MSFVLNKIDPKYYQELFSWRSDPYARKYNPFAKCDFEEFSKRLDDMESDFSKVYEGKSFKWAILGDKLEIQAVVGLHNIDKMMKIAEIGYQVGPDFRKKGLGLKIVKNFVFEIFKQTDLRKLIATIADENIASIKIIEKVGFIQEGLLRKQFLIDERAVDERFYGLLREEL